MKKNLIVVNYETRQAMCTRYGLPCFLNNYNGTERFIGEDGIEIVKMTKIRAKRLAKYLRDNYHPAWRVEVYCAI